MDIAKLAKIRPDLVGQPDEVVLAALADDYPNTPPEHIAADLGLTLAKPPETGGVISDIGKSLKQGALQLPGQLVGLADLPSALAFNARPLTNAANAIGEATGFQPGKWANEVKLSDAANRSKEEVDQAWRDATPDFQGAAQIAGAYLAHPAYSLNQVAQSVPSMLAGGVGGRALMTAGRIAVPAAEGAAAKVLPGYLERMVGEKLAAPIAGGVGEGAQQTGQQMQQDEDLPDQRKNAIAALASGFLDAVIAAGAGRAANAMGFETAQTLMAGGTREAKATAKSLTKDQLKLAARMALGATNEGVLQEFPQSMQEQMWQNWTEGKPLMEGVLRQGVEGGIAGGIMGAGANAVSHAPETAPGAVFEGKSAQDAPPGAPPAAPAAAPAGPIQRAVAAASDPFGAPIAPVVPAATTSTAPTPQADADPFSQPIAAPTQVAEAAPAAEPAAPAAPTEPVPITSEIDAAAHEAATSPNNALPEPTDAQKQAGNYKLGHLNVQGLDISIENPQGSVRSGKRPDGTEWKHTMSNHYGYVRGTEGADGDHVDVYVGPKPDAPNVWVVDQVNQHDSSFDETKAMVGFASRGAAVNAYRSNFDKGWILGRVTEMPMEQFKEWLKNGDTTKPASPKGPLNSQGQPNASANPQAPADAGGQAVPGGAGAQLPSTGTGQQSGGVAQPDAHAPASTTVQPNVAPDANAPAQPAEGVSHAAATEPQAAAGSTAQATEPAPAARPAAAAGAGTGVEAAGSEPLVQHVTGKGKTLTGYVRKISEAEAKAIDPGSFRKDGGFFLRKERADAAAPAPAEKPAATSAPKSDKAEIRPFRKPDGSIGYEAVPIAKGPEPKPEPAPETKPAKPQPSADTLRAQADLNNALADLGDLFGKPFRANIAPEQEAKLIPILTRVLDAAFRLGYHKFKDAAKFSLDQIRSNFGDEAADAITLDHLQGAYIAMAGGKQGTDTKRAVIDVEDKAEVEGHTATLESGPDNIHTSPKDTANANPAQPDEVPAGAAPEGAGNVAAGDQHRQPLDDGLAGADEGSDRQPGVPAGARGAGEAGTRGVQPAGNEPSGTPRDSGASGTEKQPSERVAGDPATAPESDKPHLDDFNLKDEDIGKGGLARKYSDNIAAIKILKAMAADNRHATPDERRAIARYVGWGALKSVFDPSNAKWAKQHAELKDLLSEAEWRAAKASMLNAHFTSKSVVSAMYSALDHLGAATAPARVLEPSVGVGNFFGLMPEALRKMSILHGVELDPLTSQIVAALYPSAKIAQATGFEDFQIPAEFFDIAIGNPPFGSEPIVDSERSPYSGFSIHNYFLAKSIDKLRPGGLLAMVVSHNFMDAQNDAARKWIADRADLLGAVRLPDTAFKENAGTEVVTDIVFLRKREGGAAANGITNDVAWTATAKQSNTNPKTGEKAEHTVNEYFIAHPESVLGTPSAAGTMYGPNQYTVTARAGDIEDHLTSWIISTLPERVYQPIDRTQDMQATDVVIPPGVKVGSFFADDKGVLRQRTADSLGKQTSQLWIAPNAKAELRLRGMIGLRDALRDQMRMERSTTVSASEVEAGRARLNTLYDDFQKQYGYLNDPTNRRVFLDDTDSPLVQMLEFNYDRGVSNAVAAKEDIPARPPTADKADIFRMRVAFPPNENVQATSAKDALLASLNYRGRVDVDYMARLYGKTADEIVKELGDLVFADPLHGIVTADEYLSGDVKTKLEEARAAAIGDPAYKKNVAALEKVIPADKMPSEIHAALGAFFVPEEVYSEFATHVTGTGMTAHFLKATGQWITHAGGNTDRVKNETQWGTSHVSAQSILKLTMAGRTPIVTQTHKVGDKTVTVVLEKETEAARDKQRAMKEEWQKWLWADGERADKIAAIYNEKMNRLVDRKFDGSHLTFPGMNPAITLLDHQRNGVWRGVQSRQMLLDQVVGAGKTYQLAAIAMELRRLGAARKPLLAVPNHLTLQWRDEFARLYPGSKVLAATPDDFKKDNRAKFFSKIVTGDWDTVIVGHSSLKKIGLPMETERAVLQEQIDEIAAAIEEVKRGRGDRNIMRDMEGIKKRLEAKMKERLANLGTRDKVLTFDELGLDALMVDELHEFKNLFYNSTMDRNAGMGNPAGSDKAFDLFVKIRWLTDTFGDKAPLITATGTPVSNSLVEMFNMQRLMQYPTLKEEGLHTFDGWANQFGSVESVYEVSPSGTGYRTATRFAKFKNLPALMGHYKSFADIVTLDDLKAQEEAQGKRFPVPKMKTGRPMLVVAPRSPTVAEFMGVPHLAISEDGNVMFGINLGRGQSARVEEKDGQFHAIVTTEGNEQYPSTLGTYSTSEQAELAIVQKALTPDIQVDPHSILGQFANLRELTKATKGKVNALSLTGLANKAGLDFRLIDPTAPDFADSKINKAVTNALALWKSTKDDRGTQLIFSDLSTPLSARSGFASKARRAYVREDGALVDRKATLHTVEGQEQLPFLVVQRTNGGAKSYDVHDAASGLRARAGFNTKADAVAWATETINDPAMREKWIVGQENAGEISQAEIDDYNAENEIDTEETEHISRSDIAGMSGSSKFSVYDDIRAKLMRGGVPEHQIAFIHDYGTPTAKAKLFARVNSGDVRFLLGSTPKLGAGTNVQKRLVGLHHIDAPWRPSDLEQREGRILRRGNELYERDPDGFEVSIWRYATAQTYDTRRWQLIEHKARVVEQLRKYDGTTNEIEDVDGEAASAADMKAAASGDPLILEETRLRTEIKRLENLRAAHADAVATMRRNARYSSQYAETTGPKSVAGLERLQATAKALPVPKDGIGDLSVNGTKAADKEQAVSLIQRALAGAFSGVTAAKFQYRGLTFTFDNTYGDQFALMSPEGGTMDTFKQNEAVSPSGLLTRFENYIDRIPARIEDIKARIKEETENAKGMLEASKKPFTDGPLLDRTREEYRKVQRQLITKGPEVPENERPQLQRALAEQKQTLIDEGYGKALEEFIGNDTAGGFVEPVQGTFSEAAQVRHGISGLGNDTDVVFSQSGTGAGTATGRRVGELQAVADPIAEKLGVSVDVYASVASPSVPKEVRDEARARIARGGNVPSAVLFEGRVLIFADRTPNEGKLVESVLHEVYGHAGLRGKFGAELDAILRQIAAARPAQVTTMMTKNGMKPEERLRAAEEILAEMAQKNPQLGFVRRAIAALRTFLRKLGLKVELTNDEITRSFLIPAREFVTGKTAPGAVSGMEFSGGQSPFYSALSKGIEAVPDKALSAIGWTGALNALVNKGKAKADEIEWSGVKDWLETQPGKITKESLLSFLATNGVRVQESVKTARDLNDTVDNYIVELDALGYTVDRQAAVAGEMKVTNRASGYEVRVNDDGDVVDQADKPVTGHAADVIRNLGSAIYEGGDFIDDGFESTRYGTYTLPGGTNYREVLLTLPAAPRKPRFDVMSRKDGAIIYKAESQEAAQAWIAEHQGMPAARGAKVVERDMGQPAAPEYRSNHWDEPNILAHIRLNDRTDADGKRVLFVEEIQSDWAQEGKKKGFRRDAGGLSPTEEARFQSLLEDGRRNLKGAELAEFESLLARRDAEAENRSAPPSAPFVENTDAWTRLALKRIVKMAVDEGYDRVAFVTGQQSADRYGLESHIRSLRVVTKDKQGLAGAIFTAMPKGGDRAINRIINTQDDLSELVGAEMAQKIVDAQPTKGTGGSAGHWIREVSGLDLKMGGEGMKAFYDKIVPAAANKLLKALGGGKVGPVQFGGLPAGTGNRIRKEGYIPVKEAGGWQIEIGGTDRVGPVYATWKEAEDAVQGVLDGKSIGAHQLGFDITPEMRAAAADGLPLFNQSADDLRQRLEKRAKELFPAESGLLHMADWITKDGRVLNGLHDRNGIIHVSSEGPNPEATFSHEAFHHAMRAYFTNYEQSKLRERFYEGTEMAQRVEKAMLDDDREHLVKYRRKYLYEKDDIGNEEIVAFAFQYWKQGKLQFNEPPVKSAFAKLNDFLERIALWLADVLTLQGILPPGRTSAESLFQKLDSGDIGRRRVKIAVRSQTDAEEMPTFNQSAGSTDPHDWFRSVTGIAREYTDTPGKLNWWHKTFGTPFNLAQRFPAYRKVYDRVQDFLNDVSRYATVAADLAPRILPKLEGFKGMFKSPLKAADNKAIARPIIDGTLRYTRDVHGKPVLVSEAMDSMSIVDKGQMLLRLKAISPQVLQMWQGMQIEQYEAMVNASFKKNAPGIVWSDEELRTVHGLTADRIGLYREALASANRSITDLVKADMLRYAGKDADPIRDTVLGAATLVEAGETARDYLMSLMDLYPDRRKVLADMADRVMAKANRGQRLIDKGYFPLSRFGTYTLDVVDADGERVYFGLFESRMERRQMQSKMEKLFPGSTIKAGTTSQEEHKLFAGMTPETAELFGELLGLEPEGEGAANVAFQEFIKRSKASRSAMKRLLERKGIEGFSEDIGRVLAGFVYSNSRQIAQSLHTKGIAEAAQEIPQGQGELKDAAVRLMRYVQEPQEEAIALRGVLFAQYLGGSIAAMLVNMTQPIQVTMPFLSQYGGIRQAAGMMKGAIADVWKKTLEPGLHEALQKAVEEGIVAPQEIHQLMAQARGRGQLHGGDGTKLGDALAMGHNALAKVVHGWGQPFAVAELFNRRVTFIAAYRTAVKQGIADPAKFAANAVNQTQFVYNKGNKPALGRGAVGSVLMTFKSYSISYLELMQRMWTSGPEGKKAALFMLAMLVLMGGAGGLPFEDDLLDLVDGIGQRLGYNMRSRHARQQFLESTLGKTFGNFVDKGVSGLPGVPVDVAARFGMGNMIPGTGLLMKKDDHTRDVTELLGPAGDMATRGFQAANLVAEGKPLQAGLSVAPKAAANWAKAAEMANLGYYTDAKGRKVIDVDAWDAASKFIGFQPNAVAQTQQATADVQQMVAMARMKESEIADRWAKGLFQHDIAAAQSAREEVTAWNTANPESPIRITPAQLNKRVHDMRKTKEERLAGAAPKEVRAEVLRELRNK